MGIWREIGIFGAGALAGFGLSRLAPPVVAQGIGMAQSAAGSGDAFDDLIHDHRVMLDTLEEMASAQGIGKRTPLLLRLKRDITKHALGEEDVIYPLIRDVMNAPQESEKLYREHAEMKILLAEIEESIADETAWTQKVRRLRDVMAEHARDEETNEFPRLRQSLGDQRQAMVSGKVYREKALVL